MNVEQELRHALHGADAYTASGDLFARVQRSVEETRAHRRRVRMVIAGIAGGVLASGVYLAVLGEVVDGRVVWPWWALELLTNLLLVVLILVVGPLIRRFGGILARSVFTAHPPTSAHFLRALDVAYYLVFVAFVLIEAQVVADPEWLEPAGQAAQIDRLTGRVGGMLMLMGALHAVTISLLPVLGVVFSSIWRQLPPDQRDPDGDRRRG